jgi:hypothetical protein
LLQIHRFDVVNVPGEIGLTKKASFLIGCIKEDIKFPYDINLIIVDRLCDMP